MRNKWKDDEIKKIIQARTMEYTYLQIFHSGIIKNRHKDTINEIYLDTKLDKTIDYDILTNEEKKKLEKAKIEYPIKNGKINEFIKKKVLQARKMGYTAFQISNSGIFENGKFNSIKGICSYLNIDKSRNKTIDYDILTNEEKKKLEKAKIEYPIKNEKINELIKKKVIQAKKMNYTVLQIFYSGIGGNRSLSSIAAMCHYMCFYKEAGNNFLTNEEKKRLEKAKIEYPNPNAGIGENIEKKIIQAKKMGYSCLQIFNAKISIKSKNPDSIRSKYFNTNIDKTIDYDILSNEEKKRLEKAKIKYPNNGNKMDESIGKKIVQARRMGYTVKNIFDSEIIKDKGICALEHIYYSCVKNYLKSNDCIKYDFLNKSEKKKLEEQKENNLINKMLFSKKQIDIMVLFIEKEKTFNEMIELCGMEYFQNKRRQQVADKFYELRREHEFKKIKQYNVNESNKLQMTM